MKTRKLIKLSSDLEKAILYGLLLGYFTPEVVRAEELSKIGAAIYRGISSAFQAGSPPPEGAVLLHAIEVSGLPKAEVKAYLAEITKDNVGRSAGDILQSVRDKQTILDLINEATAQLQKATPNVSLLSGLLTNSVTTCSSVMAVADLIKDGLPPPPQGLALGSLRTLASHTGGIIGMWAIAGEPKVGKSTLSWQLAIDVGRHTPVLYYDFENGFPTLMDRTRAVYKGDLPAIRQALQKVYWRDDIRSLDRDLAAIPAPALIVIDSVQKLPGSVEYRRQGIDRWVHRLEALKKRGYYVLIVSEVGRAQYNSDPYIGSFKETGEIEYSADVGIQLIPESADLVGAYIVANRHRKHKGMSCMLKRVHDWWWKELNTGNQEGEEID